VPGERQPRLSGGPTAIGVTAAREDVVTRRDGQRVESSAGAVHVRGRLPSSDRCVRAPESGSPVMFDLASADTTS